MRRGLDVTNVDLVHVLSQMFRQTFGEWATLVFLAGAFFVLYSTLFGATAANALLLADALSVFRLVRYTDENARRRVIRDASIGLSLASTAMFLVWSQPVTLVLIGATAQALMLPFLGVCSRSLPARARRDGGRRGLAARAGRAAPLGNRHDPPGRLSVLGFDLLTVAVHRVIRVARVTGF